MDVSIIIINYNTSLLLKNCLQSIFKYSTLFEFEIIVVDNASIDDSCQMIKFEFPTVKLIESKTNLGFGRANNLGATYANGKYLFLLNSDTLLIDNSIKVLFDFMNENVDLNVGACCGNLYKEDLSPNYSYSLNLPTLSNIFKYRAHLTSNDENFNTSNKNKDIANVIGADLFIRKELFDKLDGFDPVFFMYVEDSELSYRIKKNNNRIVSVPTAKFIHLQGKSSTSSFKIKLEIDGYIYFFLKHSNKFSLFIYLILEMFFCILRIFIYLLLIRFKDCMTYISTFKHLMLKMNIIVEK